MSVQERLAELAKLKDYIVNNKQRIVDRIVEETGKSDTDALVLEVFPALDIIDYYQKNAAKFLADQKVKTPVVLMGKKSRVFYEPLGVILVISPWNYPFHLSFVPIVCALVAGNACVLKPSRFTPLRGVLEDMVNESGFLKDALQVVYASRKTAQALIDERPDKIMFTGSVGVGKKIMEQAAKLLIPVELELGGKDPMVVFEDVDLDRTVNGALWGSFCNCGQTCTSVERVYVQEKIYDDFVAKLKEKLAKLRTLEKCDGKDDKGALDVGCMTANFQIEEIEAQLADAKAKGAEVVVGGGRIGDSHVIPPTIVVNVDDTMAIAKDETFGPVVTVGRFKSEDEAVAWANDSPFGLSASVWSADLERADRVARRIVTGNVSINSVLATQANCGLPFGGIKDSGFGRYRGPFGLHSFSNIKSVLIDKQSSKPEMYWYPYSKTKYEMLKKLMDALFGGGPLGLLKAAVLGMKLESMAKRERL
jgi:acyl-CoA reductase-like NAD-dependent aldehyde dehydrogenase